MKNSATPLGGHMPEDEQIDFDLIGKTYAMGDIEIPKRTIVAGSVVHTIRQSPSSGRTPYNAQKTGGDPNDGQEDEDDAYNANRDKGDKYQREFTLVSPNKIEVPVFS